MRMGAYMVTLDRIVKAKKYGEYSREQFYESRINASMGGGRNE